MPWAKRRTVAGTGVGSGSSTWDMNDYSEGMNSYLANDKFPVMTGQTRRLMGPNMWRLAQDARIVTLGEYETRQGFDFYSSPAGETQDQSITSTAGAADQSFNTVTRLAQKFTTTSAGALTRLDVNLKNAAGATGTIMAALYTDNAGSPATQVGSTSIAVTSLTSSYGYITFRFASAPILTNATVYWIVIYVQAFGSGSYAVSSTTASTTAKVSTNSGVTWSTTSFSLNYKQYFSTIGAQKGLFRAYKNDGTKVTLMAHGTSLYTVNEGTGALTAIKTGLNASATNYRFEIFNDIVYYVNGFDGYRKWDGTTESQILSVNYKLIRSHKGLMFLAAGPDPNAIIFSQFGLPEAFTSTDFVYADAPKTGDPVVALNSLNGYLLVFTKDNKFILSGSDNATFTIDEAPDQKGTYTQETVTQDANFVYFLSDDGVYRSNGSEAQLMSQNIYEDIRTLQNKTSVCMCINRGRLYMWFRSPTAGLNDSCFVWNLNFSSGSSFTIESKDTGAYVSQAFSAYLDSDNMLVGSSLVGQIFWQELASNDFCNLGEPINWLVQAPYFTAYAPAVLKEYRYWEPRFSTSDSSYTVDCDYAYDLRDNWTTYSSPNLQGNGPIWGSGIVWGSFIWGSSQELQNQLYIPGEYRRTAVRYKHFAARQPVHFLGHTLQVQTRRLR